MLARVRFERIWGMCNVHEIVQMNLSKMPCPSISPNCFGHEWFGPRTTDAYGNTGCEVFK